MSRMVIVLGDPTTGGGTVITGSPFTDIDGKPVARIGDQASCPRCKGTFPIVSGDATFVIDGQPVARERDYLACGCRLMSARQFRVLLDEGGGDVPAAGEAMFDRASAAAKHYHEQYRAVDEATGIPIAGQPYRIDMADGTTRSGVTDEQGLTIRVSTAAPEQVRLVWLEVEQPDHADTDDDAMEGC